MKVRVALAEPEQKKISRYVLDNAVINLLAGAGAAGNQLLCQKCGGSIGYWSGAWAFLEGDDHPSIPYMIVKHRCGVKTMLDAPKGVLWLAGERLKQVRRHLPNMPFELQMDLYKQYLKEEWDIWEVERLKTKGSNLR